MKRTILTVNENHGAPPLKKSVGEIIRRISETLPDLQEPVSMYPTLYERFRPCACWKPIQGIRFNVSQYGSVSSRE